MCGFVAWWSPRHALPEEDRLIRIRDLMTTRGPDGAGLWRTPNIALGHRRLAVLDVSSAGAQPMERRGVMAVYNGEIYNFATLRAELREMGETLTSGSDTEILPIGLRVWGFAGLLERLDGMFAFALWDSWEQALYLARDRVGKKPLFYSLRNGAFTAASDLKVVAASQARSPEINAGVLPLYLYHGFIPAPWTIYEGISKLAPASAAIIRLRNGALEKTEFRYWSPHYAPKQALSSAAADEAVDELIERAVRKRLVADVPVGAFLSGGVDSSLVVAHAARQVGKLRTFSVGFTHQSHNELPYARKVAAHCGTEHTEEILEVDALADLPRIVWNHGEPFADSSAVPSHAVANAARKEVTVVLTGDGGDEGFAGYPRTRVAWLAGHYKGLVPLPWRNRAEQLLAAACTGSSTPPWLARAWTLARYGAAPDDAIYHDPDLWRDDLRGALLSPETKKRMIMSPRGWQSLVLGEIALADDFDRIQALDLLGQLPNDYLTKVDVATMSVGLEARSPLLDVHLLEFAATLPRSILMPRGEGKAVLKRLCAARVPREVVYRRKAGFALPLAAWMRGPYRDAISAMLLAPPFTERGWFCVEAVRRLLQEHFSGRQDHAGRIWTLLVWETWCRIFLDSEPLHESSAGLWEVAA
jgi:asparagine synthase (glutamine-hydrolysing)